MRTIFAVGSTLVLLGLVAVEAQASSCQAFFSQCAARCASNPAGHTQAKCTADHCRPKFVACRKSGCWTEGARFGGGKTCNLPKS